MRVRTRHAIPLAVALVASACADLVGIDTNFQVTAHDGGSAAPDAAVAEAAVILDAPIDVVDAAIAPPHRPPAGTYSYTVSGYDQLDGFFPSEVASYGPTATVKIAYTDSDCFDMTITLRKDYDDTMHLCVVGLELVEDGGTRTQKFAVGSASTTVKCTPGDTYYSASTTPALWMHDCLGQNTDTKTNPSLFEAHGDYVYRGDEVAPGTNVLSRHYHDLRSVNGLQNGKNEADWYFSVDGGVLEHLTRAVDVQYAVPPLGTVRYREMTTLTLTPAVADAGSD